MVVGVLCGLATIAVRPGTCAPRADVDAGVHEAGAVVAGERVEHAFAIRNAGDAALELRVTQAPPGAAATCDPVVAAGEVGRVRVAIDTLGFDGASSTTIGVATNDPARARVDLTLRLEVRHVLAGLPGKARFVFVRGAAPVTVPQTIRATDDVPFRVREVVSAPPGVTVDLGTGAPRVEWPVALTLRSDAPVGPLTGVVELRTNHPAQRRVAIAVSGFVRPVVAVTPPRLELGDGSAPWRASLHVRSFAEEAIALRGATSDLPGVTLSIRTVEPGRVWAVDVESAGGATPAGTIRLETSSPVEPVVSVPVAPGG